VDDFSLRLEGGSLVFPDGVARCLACGAAPVGHQRAVFETPDTSKDPAVALDAPLCATHLAHARRLLWKTVFHGLLSVACWAASWLLISRYRLDQKSEICWLLPLPGIAFFCVAVMKWASWQRAGLTCAATRLDDGLVEISYPKK